MDPADWVRPALSLLDRLLVAAISGGLAVLAWMKRRELKERDLARELHGTVPIAARLTALDDRVTKLETRIEQARARSSEKEGQAQIRIGDLQTRQVLLEREVLGLRRTLDRRAGAAAED